MDRQVVRRLFGSVGACGSGATLNGTIFSKKEGRVQDKAQDSMGDSAPAACSSDNLASSLALQRCTKQWPNLFQQYSTVLPHPPHLAPAAPSPAA